MDPNANLREQLQLAEMITEVADSDDDFRLDDLLSNATRLAELVTALNQWISNGGFLPEGWRK